MLLLSVNKQQRTTSRMFLKGRNEENNARNIGMQLGEHAVKLILVQEVACYTYNTFSRDNLMFTWPMMQSV
jgi:hypothetical protein